MSVPPQGAEDLLEPDPRGFQPSPIPGMTQLEFDEIAENILWYAALPPGAKIRRTRHDVSEIRRFARIAESVRGG